MAMRDKMMDIEPQKRRAPSMVWPIAIGLGTAMLAGGFAGYNQAAAENGDAVLAPWIGPVVAILVGGLALAFTHPWLALAIVVTISLSFAFFVWWLWRRLFRRTPRPQAG